ncbi:MAG: hypothetical protein H6Q67_385 [Firmicutes bacterium]|nr:hypothetical protein [Bacillota bacterium]
MGYFFVVIFLIAIIYFIIGMVNPKLTVFFKDKTRENIFIISTLLFGFSFIGFSLAAGKISVLFPCVSVVAVIFLVAGILNPNLSIFWGEKESRTKKKVLSTYLSILIISFLGFTLTYKNDEVNQKEPLSSTSQIISNQTNTIKEDLKTNATTNTTSNEEFLNFYRDFKKYHNELGETFNKLQIALDKTATGKANPVDFYNFLKATDNLFLIAWSDLDKKTIPNGLNDAQKEEVKQCLDELSFSALTGKEAVESLMEGMNNPNSMEAKSSFKDNIQKALIAHKVAGENIEKIKSELSIK